MEKKPGGPRLPDSFYSTYRQTKESTAIILRWVHMTVAGLRERARAHATPSFSGRGQGKRARGPGTNRPQSTALDGLDITSPKIPLRLFLQHVREIAASDVVIPTVYLVHLEAAIKQRKRTASFYSSDAEAWEQNKTHLYAIKAYTEALSILQEAQQKRAETDGGLAEDIHNTLAIHDADNIFALSEAMHQLAVIVEGEGLGGSGTFENEWLRDNPMLNSSKSSERYKKSRPFALDEYELVPDDYSESKSKKPKSGHDDSFEALKCFLLDVHRMRQFCQNVWSSVIPAGNTTYIAASFVTNKAVQLVKEMEYALIADFPILEEMNNTFNILLGVLHSQMPNGTPEQRYSFEEKIMFHTWNTLKQFAKMLDDNPLPVLRDGHFGYFDPLADRENMMSIQRFLEDRCIMMNHWPDLVLLSRYCSSFIGSQGLAQDFKAFYHQKSRPVTWALIFACQMQADSVLARRRYLNYDLHVMRNLGSIIGNEYETFLADGVEYDSNMNLVAKPYINEQKVEIATWLESDPVMDLKIRHGFHELSKQASQKDSLWLQNSWLTANAISEATMNYFFAGAAVVGAGGFVQSSIQLWNMLKQTGYLSSPPTTSATIMAENSTSIKEHVLLFDHLLDVFGDKVFSGPPPKSGFLKQWELMMGVRPEEFAKGKRQYKKNAKVPLRPRAHNEAGRGILVTISELWNLHYANYFSSETKQASNKQYQHPLAATLDLVNSELGQSTAATSPSGSETRRSRGPLLNLNLLKIHRLCFRIFAELEPVLRPDIERIIGEPLEHTQINWPYLTGWIAQTELLPANNGVPDPVLLKKAAEVMERLAGSKELGFFLMHYEADEHLVQTPQLVLSCN